MSSACGVTESKKVVREISPCWVQFIAFCEKMGFGEIENLKIQNGVPMMAEQVTKKIKFS